MPSFSAGFAAPAPGRPPSPPPDSMARRSAFILTWARFGGCVEASKAGGYPRRHGLTSEPRPRLDSSTFDRFGSIFSSGRRPKILMSSQTLLSLIWLRGVDAVESCLVIALAFIHSFVHFIYQTIAAYASACMFPSLPRRNSPCKWWLERRANNVGSRPH